MNQNLDTCIQKASSLTFPSKRLIKSLPHPIIIGIMGRGEVGIGAKEMLQHFNLKEIPASEIKADLDPSNAYFTILS